MNICIVPNCTSHEYQRKQYCIKHWRRFQRHGDPAIALRNCEGPQVCGIDECTQTVHSMGLCAKHYARHKRHGNAQTVKYIRAKGDTQTERFWSMINKAGDQECWEWKTLSAKPSYGHFIWDGKAKLSTHIMFFLTHKRWPKYFMLHSCDNPPCVNPTHLREGTHLENNRDKVERGRQTRGERHAVSKLLDADVLKIKQLLKDGVAQKKIAEQFGITASNISHIHRGITWQHLTIS